LTSTRVLVAGAINTDLVARTPRAPEAGETVTGSSFAIFGGGKGANQAVAAARSGAATALLGAVGNDDFGAARRKDLLAEGINLEAVATIRDVASGVALISVESSGQNRIIYIPGTTSSITSEHAREAILQVMPALVLTTLEPPKDAMAALIESGKAAGAKVVLNATPEPEKARSLLSNVDILIVNEPEAVALLGQGASSGISREAADDLRALGPSSVVITLGGEGAIAVTDGGSDRVAAPEVDVVDTTGAGDTLCGAMVAALAEGRDFGDALRFGVYAASLAVTKEGAQTAIPRRDGIERFLAS
jgi:ribokinase